MNEFKDREWLYKKYIEERLTCKQISRLCGCHQRTIHQRLVEFGIPRRKGGVEHWSDEQKEYLRQWSKAHPEINKMKGRHHSEETKLKMSLKRRGSTVSYTHLTLPTTPYV